MLKITCAVSMNQSVILPAIIPPSCWAEIRHVVADQKTDCISFLAKPGAFPAASRSPEGQECMTGEHHKRVMDSCCEKFLLGSFGSCCWHHVFTYSCDISWNAVSRSGCCSNKQLHVHVWKKEVGRCGVCKSTQGGQLCIIFKNAGLKFFV